jgi:hypothetical protein
MYSQIDIRNNQENYGVAGTKRAKSAERIDSKRDANLEPRQRPIRDSFCDLATNSRSRGNQGFHGICEVTRLRYTASDFLSAFTGVEPADRQAEIHRPIGRMSWRNPCVAQLAGC